MSNSEFKENWLVETAIRNLEYNINHLQSFIDKNIPRGDISKFTDDDEVYKLAQKLQAFKNEIKDSFETLSMYIDDAVNDLYDISYELSNKDDEE